MHTTCAEGFQADAGGQTADFGSGGGGTVKSMLNGKAGAVGGRAAALEVGVSPSDGGLPQIAVPLSIGGCWLGTVVAVCDHTPKSASDDVPLYLFAASWRRTSGNGRDDATLSSDDLALHIFAVVLSHDDGWTAESRYCARASLGTDDILRTSFHNAGPFSLSRFSPTAGKSDTGSTDRQISVPSLGTSELTTPHRGSANFPTVWRPSQAASWRTGIWPQLASFDPTKPAMIAFEATTDSGKPTSPFLDATGKAFNTAARSSARLPTLTPPPAAWFNKTPMPPFFCCDEGDWPSGDREFPAVAEFQAESPSEFCSSFASQS